MVLHDRPVFANDIVADVPTELYGPPLVVERSTVYEVAPEDAAHDRLTCDAEAAVALTPVGAAGGVQPPPLVSRPPIVVAPVPLVSSQFDSRVLLVPPPVQETLNRP